MLQNRFLLFLLLCTTYTIPSEKQKKVKLNINWQQLRAEEKAKKLQAEKKVKRHAVKGEEGSIRVLTSQLDASLGYDQDDVNFWSLDGEGPAQIGKFPSMKRITKSPIVMVNSHGTDELYLGEGPFVPGKHRSLNWGSSLQEADALIQHQMDLHDNLALPLVWSGNKYRTHVTFTIIPAGTEIEFKKGSASSQKVGEDYRPGGGQQIRMKYIPANSITITKKLLPENKATLVSQKGIKPIDFRKLLEDGINEYNDMYPDKEQLDAKELAYASYSSDYFDQNLVTSEEYQALTEDNAQNTNELNEQEMSQKQNIVAEEHKEEAEEERMDILKNKNLQMVREEERPLVEDVR